MRVPTIISALALAATPFVGAQAMPMARPIPLAGTDSPAITLTAGGCGLGFHRGVYGVCHPNLYGGYGVGFRPYGYGYGVRRFGYGYHRGYFRRF